MIIVDIPQGSEQWYQEKIGKPSASNASKIITNEGKKSKQREGYLYQLASEIILNKSTESYQNGYMQEGQDREEESRAYYELINGVDVKQVGVVYKDEARSFLCSPDGLILPQAKGLEMKNVIPKTQVKYLLENRLPPDYFGQVQFSMYVTGYEKWDFLSYVPNMKPLLITAKRDKQWISVLEKELNLFCEELETIINKLR